MNRMCGRYYIADEDAAEELKQIIDEVNRKYNGSVVKLAGEVYPTDTIPVIANGRSEQTAAFAMAWGHRFKNGPMVFNARSEDAETKPMFADGMKQRRCLVPASCYYEWEHVGKEKIKYAIKSKGSRMIYMAGIYRPVQAKGKRIGHECFILTRDPAEEIRFIHDRMPAILPEEATVDWLNPKYAAGDVLKAAAMDMEYHQISGQIHMFA